jgi:hypothetical protein
MLAWLSAKSKRRGFARLAAERQEIQAGAGHFLSASAIPCQQIHL